MADKRVHKRMGRWMSGGPGKWKMCKQACWRAEGPASTQTGDDDPCDHRERAGRMPRTQTRPTNVRVSRRTTGPLARVSYLSKTAPAMSGQPGISPASCDAERASRSLLLDQYQAVRNYCPLSSCLAVASPTTEVEKPQTGPSRDDESDVSTRSHQRAACLQARRTDPPTCTKAGADDAPQDAQTDSTSRARQATPPDVSTHTSSLVAPRSALDKSTSPPRLHSPAPLRLSLRLRSSTTLGTMCGDDLSSARAVSPPSRRPTHLTSARPIAADTGRDGYPSLRAAAIGLVASNLAAYTYGPPSDDSDSPRTMVYVPGLALARGRRHRSCWVMTHASAFRTTGDD
ncbi:uncharacterized protein B0H18DRAFT_961326 [Fomitopsis serialis]|uniref:uncharacterized protein n=1 Tax=Fomitopsis serialis TaxID=139415 RepID=UPI002007C681|nr:uncharacterized protein B0H18DRAFT_961326 [Neoantrodia serialis]KAH9912172.1 hypothetical protein B0H18DRAFT_961326 [Neoantrodia serialis]